MKTKKLLIADMAIIFLLAALLLAAGIYYLLTVDPFAFMKDGTLDNTGVAGLIIIFVMGIPALIIKLLIYLWLIIGVLFLFFGIAVGICLLSTERLNGLRVCLGIFAGLSIAVAFISFTVTLFANAALSGHVTDDPAFAFILSVIMRITLEVSTLTAVMSIHIINEMKTSPKY